MDSDHRCEEATTGFHNSTQTILKHCSSGNLAGLYSRDQSGYGRLEGGRCRTWCRMWPTPAIASPSFGGSKEDWFSVCFRGSRDISASCSHLHNVEDA